MRRSTPIPAGRPLRLLTRALVLAALVVAMLPVVGHRDAHAVVPLLTKAQRQAYLNYYAPVIFKRANEDNGEDGRDWLTNYDFDQDHNYATNRVNWLNVKNYVAASAARATTSPYAKWRIRPT